MIYDRLPVALVSALAQLEPDSPNAQLARYLLAHANDATGISVRALCEACHVGAGTVSRFAREMGFADFAELRAAFDESSRSFERVGGASIEERMQELARRTTLALAQVQRTLDAQALGRLAHDIASFEKVSAFGLLKAQSAATELQVGLLMQGRLVHTCGTPVRQFAHLETARGDELVVVFSYTAAYFDACGLGQTLRRPDRPRIWVVCGSDRPLPPFVHDRLLFRSSLEQLAHPYQLQFAASLIAQEYAALMQTT